MKNKALFATENLRENLNAKETGGEFGVGGEILSGPM